MSAIEIKTESLHGREAIYTEAGKGPALLLVHGLGGNFENWQEVIGPLARNHTVIAPDLPGHGASAGGGGDYSVGALAASLRDLLVAIGHERVTLVGHSLGGGVSMQFAYQFPEMVERLVLVSSAATAGPGQWIGGLVGRGLGAIGLRPNADLAEVLRGYGTLEDPVRRAAFVATVRAVIGTGGQRVDAKDRLYLAENVPVLIVWGAQDRIIPASHAADAHRHIPGSRLEVFDGVGHLPQLEAPLRFVTVLEEFIAETEAAEFTREDWQQMLRAHEQDAA